jgi:hypothetical protein
MHTENFRTNSSSFMFLETKSKPQGETAFNGTPAAQQLRERMDKWDYMKLKNICTTKEMVSLIKLTKMRREKIQISKIRNTKGEITTNTMEARKSSETTLRTCIQINLKILKKWTDVYILTIIQN